MNIVTYRFYTCFFSKVIFSMNKIGIILIFIYFNCLSTVSSAGEKAKDNVKTLTPNANKSLQVSNYDKQLWHENIHQYLQDPLWISRDIYDASHHLMVPLHAAFLLKERAWQQDFDSHFRRFLKAYPEGMESGVKQRLNRMHYFYLVSRYLALTFDDSGADDFKKQLYEVCINEIKKVWNEDPAWQWGRSPFSMGVRDRVLWKLQTKDVPKSYYRAIIDEELFLFAIAADLLVSSSLVGDAPSKTLLDIMSIAHRVFESEIVETKNGGWLFQPGVWYDGPGHAYAGQPTKLKGMKVRPLLDVAWDSSHSHRFPLWITSLENAYVSGSEENLFFKNLRKGLTIQIINEVLIPPSETFPVWRVANYMDGRNGVYRWREKDKFGYGPYELSGTFLIGWWSFLNSKEISTVYNEIASSFPLPSFVIKKFVGPNASRERNSLLILPNQYKNGFIELNVRLAAKLYFSES